jgi:acetyl-CoA synthetase
MHSKNRDKLEVGAERPAIDSALQEARSFPPPVEFRKKANYNNADEYEKLWRASLRQPEKFWGKVAKDCLVWNKPFKKVLDWKIPFAKWFVGGKLNVSENGIDRHLSSWRRNKAALIWEGEPGDQRVLTYQMLHHEVSKCANMLLSLGLKTGGCAAIYMPLIPELMITRPDSSAV